MRKGRTGLQKQISRIFTGIQIPQQDDASETPRPIPPLRPRKNPPKSVPPKPVEKKHIVQEQEEETVITLETLDQPLDVPQIDEKLPVTTEPLDQQLVAPQIDEQQSVTLDSFEQVDTVEPVDQQLVAPKINEPQTDTLEPVEPFDSTEPIEQTPVAADSIDNQIDDVEQLDSKQITPESVEQQPDVVEPVTPELSEPQKIVADKTVEQPQTAKPEDKIDSKPLKYTKLPKQTVYEPPAPAPARQKKPLVQEMTLKPHRKSKLVKALKEKFSGMLQSKHGVSSGRQKVTVLLAGVMAVVFVIVIINVLKKPGPAKTRAAKKAQASSSITASVAFNGKINWQLPAPYPEEMRDPMLFGASTSGEDQTDRPIVKGIVFSEDNPSAVINNQVVVVGDVIQGATVVKINQDSVEFKMGEETWVAKVKR